MMKKLFSLGLCALSLSGVVRGQTGGQAPGKARIKIDIERTIGEVNPALYGAFLEPIHRTVYGRIYDPRSPFADEDGFRKDLIALLRELKVTNVRYPGGNMVSGYNWEDGIGPKDKRPARLELAWNQVDSNQMGTDEYVKFFGKIGAENILCVNAGTGTVDQARHWVEYCNSDRGTYYAGLRKQNGHPQPYKITHWGIGNEVDGPWQMGYKNVEDYCKFALEAAKLMKWTDTSIRLTASGSANYFNDEFPDADWIKWNRTVLTELRQYIDYLSIHRYWEDKTKDYYTFMSGAQDLEEKIGITAGLIKEVTTKYRLKKPVYIAFDEYAVAIPPNYLNGICLAQYFNAFIRHADLVKQANYTQLSELAADAKTGFYKTPITHVFKLYSNTCLGTSLDVQVLCDQFDAGLYKHIPYLDVTAVYDRAGKRVIINVVNRHKEQSITADIFSQTGGWGPKGTVNVLDGKDLQATNSPEQANVTVKTQAIERVGKEKCTYTFPPHSFSQIILEQTGDQGMSFRSTPGSGGTGASTVGASTPGRGGTIHWSDTVLVNNVTPFTDQGGVPEAGPTSKRRHGTYGSQYARMLELKDGSWLTGYTVSRRDGYDRDQPFGPASTGGLELEVARSMDQGKSWKVVSTISEPGRDLDNSQLIETRDGSVLLACRSVRWQESYILRVYKSGDKGQSWRQWSTFDSTAGAPGTLGHPDKGIYEPHLYYLADGRLAVQYANEKHVTEAPSYSQIISEKISKDEGRSWGKEIWVAYAPGHPDSRPGMPVWTRMKNGKYITVYEVCGPEKCEVYSKISEDGVHWPVGLGTPIPEQMGGPYIVGLTDGTLLVTSNINNISVSKDLGVTWKSVGSPWSQTLWGSLYPAGAGRIMAVNSVQRPEGGNNVQLVFGEMP